MKIDEEKIINDSDIMKTTIKKINENVFQIDQILKSNNSSDQVFINSYDLKKILSCFRI